MGSLRVPRTIEKRVSFLLEGRTLGPYFRRRCRASVSVSPVQTRLRFHNRIDHVSLGWSELAAWPGQ